MNTSTITVQVDGTRQSVPVVTTIDAPLRPSFWYSPLPDNAALHPNTTAISAEILRQSRILAPVINGGQVAPIWSSRLVVVPAGQALIKVQCGTTTNNEQAIGNTGIPIPPDIYIPPAPDTDKALLIWQPSAPNGGFMWEMQGCHWITPGVLLGCNSLSRMSGVNTRSGGHFVSWVTGPGGTTPSAVYSTWESNGWGTQGSGLPYAPGLVTRKDVLTGHVDHAILLEVYDAAANAHVWPALFRSDGGAAAGTAAANLIEGMWLRLPPGLVIDASWPLMDRLYAQAARDFGMIITDRTLSCLGVRMAEDAHDLDDDYHLVDFPWGSLQALAVGADPPASPTQPNSFYWHPVTA